MMDSISTRAGFIAVALAAAPNLFLCGCSACVHFGGPWGDGASDGLEAPGDLQDAPETDAGAETEADLPQDADTLGEEAAEAADGPGDALEQPEVPDGADRKVVAGEQNVQQSSTATKIFLSDEKKDPQVEAWWQYVPSIVKIFDSAEKVEDIPPGQAPPASK